MGIDVFSESVLAFSDAARMLPRRRGGRKVAISTLYRWAMGGLRSNSGLTVRLEVIRVGGTTCTSKEALQRFFDRLQGEPVPNVAMPSPSQEKRIREAERELRMTGMDGDARIFQTSSVSRERLCDLHIYVEGWMPGKHLEENRSYRAVRSGIFAQAVAILEGRAGGRRSMDAAKEWIASLNLSTMDVRQLPGVGPLHSDEWKRLAEAPEFQAEVSKMRPPPTGMAR